MKRGAVLSRMDRTQEGAHTFPNLALNEGGAARLALVQFCGTLGIRQRSGAEHDFQLTGVYFGIGERGRCDIHLIANLPEHPRIPQAQAHIGILKEFYTTGIEGLGVHCHPPV
ncbi:hypothetical protein AFERRI_150059 [Acidithiobacillus ferrivorans]|uniref:Uncharacterized protein n=1 Tax=Acidithiobacillus ferrivorans TaxID=160808 RepID=A0A060UR89_9PROT|nr:hypothetical protein AFERRI_150059 [Acidithiobacillus ferrivorans]